MLFPSLQLVKNILYSKLSLAITNLKIEDESKLYEACAFNLNKERIIYRKAKITPTKIGQFATLWKREGKEPIKPFEETDTFDVIIITVQTQELLGQFIFPKTILIEKGILSTEKKEGKRAIRVYPSWDKPTSQQALKTQKWQLNYFHLIKSGNTTYIEKANNLY